MERKTDLLKINVTPISVIRRSNPAAPRSLIEREFEALRRKQEDTMINRFQGNDCNGHGAVYTCSICAKKTRETGHDESSLGYCWTCLREMYIENAISDYGVDEEIAAKYVDGKVTQEEQDKYFNS